MLATTSQSHDLNILLRCWREGGRRGRCVYLQNYSSKTAGRATVRVDSLSTMNEANLSEVE